MANRFDEIIKRMNERGVSSSTHTEELLALYRVAAGGIRCAPAGKVATVLELGTMNGRSALVLAQVIRDGGFEAKVFTVDNYSAGGSLAETQANIDALGFSQIVVAIQGDDLDYLTVCPEQSLSCLFVDSWHNRGHVFKTLEIGLPKLAPLAVLCGHDYTPTEAGVILAVEDFMAGHRPNFVGWGLHGTFWWTMRREGLHK